MGEWIWLISLIGSLGAVGAAFAAWRSAKETQKTVLAHLGTNPYANHGCLQFA